MNRQILTLLLVPFAVILIPFCLPAQIAERSATTAVLRDLNLADRRVLADRLREVNAGIRERAEKGGQPGAVATTPDDDRTLYFSLLYLSYYGHAGEGLAAVRAFLERQTADGFIPATPGSHRPVSPFLAQIVLLGSKERNDFTWLQEALPGSGQTYYERLQRYLEYWLTGLDSNGNSLQVGYDDLFIFFSATTDSDTTVSSTESVALACYLYRECKAMIGLAHQLHRPEDKEAYQQRARTLTENLNAHLWDEKDGFYYDRDERAGKLIRIKSVGGVLPLFAGMAPYDRAGRLVDHLRDPAKFWTNFPLPRNIPGAGQAIGDDGNAVWIPANYMVFQGLMDYGYRDLARTLAQQTFTLAFSAELPLRTFYDAITGRSFGPPAQGGWAALAFLMPWEYELNYTPATWSWQPLVRMVPEYLEVEWK